MRIREPLHWKDCLRGVSRSFYLTLRMLPGSIRAQIGLAYLLARATDTIADTTLISFELRLNALRSLREAIRRAAEGLDPSPPDFGTPARAGTDPAQGSSAELALLAHIGTALEALRSLQLEDRLRIHELLDTITSGQESDLIRFGSAAGDKIVSLTSDADLDEYTYLVAGCVGEFWTRMCRAHLFPEAKLDDAFLLASGAGFGKGLQLVNILRDLPKDLRAGRCYIPEGRLAECGLVSRDLLDPGSMSKFRSLYDAYLRLAEDYLAAGWQYIEALPPRQVRIRLACAWPVLIGIRTLSHLRRNNILDARNRVKVSRTEIRMLILRSLISYPSSAAWNRLLRFAGNSRL
jgi:farnesyl-diphosphate farnesyltransferase